MAFRLVGSVVVSIRNVNVRNSQRVQWSARRSDNEVRPGAFHSMPAIVSTTMLAMSTSRDDQPTDPQLSDPDWFRAPSRREHWIAAGLFVGFGVFFLLLS